jgi:hypothetical protein
LNWTIQTVDVFIDFKQTAFNLKMMGNKDQAAGKLTVTPGTPVSYFNIGGDEMKSKFEQSKKEVTDATVKRIKVHESLK